MTEEEKFKTIISEIVKQSRTFHNQSDVITEKLWKLKNATFRNNEEIERKRVQENTNLCLLLLKIKEGSIREISGTYNTNKKIPIDIPNGFEQLLEKEIIQRRINNCGRRLTINEAAMLALQDRKWLSDYINSRLPNYCVYCENPELLNEIEKNSFAKKITDAAKKGGSFDNWKHVLNDTLETEYNEESFIEEFITVVKEIIDKKEKEKYEECLLEIFAKSYMETKSIWNSDIPITIDFLKEKTKELQKERFIWKDKSVNAAKAAIAQMMFWYKGDIEPGLPIKFIFGNENEKAVPIVFKNAETAPDAPIEIYGYGEDSVAVPLVFQNGMLKTRVPKKMRPKIQSSSDKYIMYKALAKAGIINGDPDTVNFKGNGVRYDKIIDYAHDKAQDCVLFWDEIKNEIYVPQTKEL